MRVEYYIVTVICATGIAALLILSSCVVNVTKLCEETNRRVTTTTNHCVAF